MFLRESSANELYQSAVDAFPRTTKRQFATHPVIIEELRWVPYKGMKTLFVKGSVRNEDRHYNTIVLFKKVDYNKNEVHITASDGKEYGFGKLSLESTDIVVRCNCDDFRYRFSWYNKLDRSLYGTPPAKYESKGVGPPANPMEIPGMCKHLMKTITTLKDAGLFLS